MTRRETLLAALAAAIAIVLINVLEPRGEKTVTVHSVSRAPAGELNAPTRDSTPPGVNPRQIEKGVAESQRAPLAPKAPPAGAQTYSCPTLYGGRLYSSRNGVHPTEFIVHYTAGPGTAESIDSYFRRTRAASATFLLEPRGHCRQEVPLSEKPWTQLAANPTSISVEIVTTGYNVSRAGWLAMPIFRTGELAALMRDSMRPYGIPLRHVDPVGCNFVPGYTDHNALECGNNHTDVLPSFPWDVLARQLHDSGAAPKAPSAHAVALCNELNHYRRESKAGTFRAKVRRDAIGHALKGHGYVCGHHGRRSVIRRKP